MPIAVALGISSVVAILPIMDLEVAVVTGAQRIFSGISMFSLLAIPFFILAGNIMNKGGIAVRLINLAKLITGRAPGALAQTNVIANMLFGAISGSGTAAASAMGSIIGPIEKEEGYDPNFSAAANIATAPTGLLIPPSNVMITFSLVSGGTSVAALFMAGYLPGILWGLACMIVIYFFAKKHGYRSKTSFTFKEAIHTILQAIPALLLIIIVIGGIIGGVFSATEGSAIAVVYALVLAFCYRSINLKSLWKIIVDSAKMSGMVVFLVGVSNILGWVMAFLQIPDAVAAALLSLTSNKYIILLIMNVILLVSGTFMDVTPAILIFTPLFLPICQSFGMSTIQFGLILVYNLCIGNITPPVGNALFVGIKVGRTSLSKVMPYMLMYYVAIIGGLLLGSVVASTDAASVFSVLREHSLSLRGGTDSLLEVESGSNDPVAYMLTAVLATLAAGGDINIPVLLAKQIILGVGLGLAIGWAAGRLIERAHATAKDAQTIFLFAVAIVAYALPSYLGGNGFLAVYLAGIVLGASDITGKVEMAHFFDTLTEMAEMTIFFLLGLLVTPARLPQMLLPGLALMAFMLFASRPIAVGMLLAPFRTNPRQVALVSWAGLRGAASVVFSLFAVVAGVPGGHDLFDLVFVIAVSSIVVQGSLLPAVAKKHLWLEQIFQNLPIFLSRMVEN